MGKHTILAGFSAMAALLVACGGGDDGSSSGGGGAGSGGASTGGSGAASSGTGGGNVGGGGGGDPYACHSTFTASGTVTPTTGDPIEISLDEADGVQVVSGDSGNTRFEALYASDMPLAKDYMGPDYAMLIDVLDTRDDSLEPASYSELGSHGATLSITGDGGAKQFFTLEIDSSSGDFVEIEEGSTSLYDVDPTPQVKASYQLTVKTYDGPGVDAVEATGTITGRFDGCYQRHDDTDGVYLE